MRTFKHFIAIVAAVVLLFTAIACGACAEKEPPVVSYEFKGTYTDSGAVTVIHYDLVCYSDNTLELKSHKDRTGTWEMPNLSTIVLKIDGTEYTASLVSGAYSFHFEDTIGTEKITVTLSTQSPGSDAEQSEDLLIKYFEPQVQELVEKYAGRTGEVILYGASTSRNWTTVAEDTGYPVQNKSFGGSTLGIRHHFIQELVYDSAPKILILPSSSNDWTSGQTVQEVLEEREEVFAEIAEALPDTVIVLYSATPNPLRYFGEYHDKMKEADEWNEAYCEEHENFVFLDLITPLTNADGSANMDVWQSDDLHLNEEGYVIMTQVLVDCLDAICAEYGISFEE